MTHAIRTKIFTGCRAARRLIVALAIVLGGAAAAAPTKLSSAAIEAVFLFNFAQFVAWPASSFSDASSPLVIGVMGTDPFGPLLDDVVRGEKINGRPLVIRRFTRVQDIDRCHILFISNSESSRFTQICAALQARSILTVSNIPNFARQGGMIELVEEKNRIRFRIALQRARSEDLEISAKLLRPAEVVRRLSPNFEFVFHDPEAPEATHRVSVVRLLAPRVLQLMRASRTLNDFSLPGLLQ